MGSAAPRTLLAFLLLAGCNSSGDAGPVLFEPMDSSPETAPGQDFETSPDAPPDGIPDVPPQDLPSDLPLDTPPDILPELPTASTCAPERMSVAGGRPWRVAVDGDVAWIAASNYVLAYDLSLPYDLGIVDAVEVTPITRVVETAGGRTYAAGGTGIAILEMNDAGKISFVGSYLADSQLDPWGIEVAGDRLYLADLLQGLVIVDVADPTAPAILGSYKGLEAPVSVRVAGNLAYVADSDSGLRVIDISDPEAPSLIGSYDVEGPVHDLRLVGDYVILVGDAVALLSLDASDPEAITSAVQIEFTDEAGPYRIFVDDTTAYVLEGSDVVALDVTDPASPFLLGASDIGGDPIDAWVDGTLAVLAHPTGLQTLDVTDPVAAFEVDYHSIPGTLGELDDAGDFLYGAGGNIMTSLDLSSPWQPEVAAETKTTPIQGSRDIQVVDSVAYMTTLSNYLFSFDVTDPTAPQALGDLDFGAQSTLGLHVLGDLAVIAGGDAGIHVVDVTDPAAMQVLVTHPIDDQKPVDVEGFGDLVYVCSWYTGIQILDLGDPIAPVPLGTYSAHGVFRLAVTEDGATTLALGDEDIGVTILDTSDPTDIQYLGSWKNEGEQYWSPDEARFVGSTAFVVGNNGGVVLDLADPTAPKLLAAFDLPSYASDLRIIDDRLYVACGSHGLQAFDISSCLDL